MVGVVMRWLAWAMLFMALWGWLCITLLRQPSTFVVASPGRQGPGGARKDASRPQANQQDMARNAYSGSSLPQALASQSRMAPVSAALAAVSRLQKSPFDSGGCRPADPQPLPSCGCPPTVPPEAPPACPSVWSPRSSRMAVCLRACPAPRTLTTTKTHHPTPLLACPRLPPLPASPPLAALPPPLAALPPPLAALPPPLAALPPPLAALPPPLATLPPPLAPAHEPPP